MTSPAPLEIEYYSDVLCVWAYCGDVRIDHLKQSFGDRIIVRTHYFSLFGDAHGRLAEQWGNRGGLAAFGSHVIDVCGQWDHLAPAHSGLWAHTKPTTSIIAHLLIKAAQLHEQGSVPAAGTPLADAFAQNIRRAFFEGGEDISDLAVLRPIAERSDYQWPQLMGYLETGRAHAALHADEMRKEKAHVMGSPTLVMNDGRQKIYGNVGYKVMEANVAELLSHPKAENASWC